MKTPDNTCPDPPLTSWQRLKSITLSVDTIRQVDRIAVEQYHMHSLVLMENAAIGCASWLSARHADPQTAVVLCGRGNNGGDGLAIARHLRLAGWRCRVILLGPIAKLSSDAHANWQILTARSTDDCLVVETFDSVTGQVDPPAAATIQQWLSESTIILDALLGSGALGAPRQPMAHWVELANALPHAERVAIDVPTGLNASSGQVTSIAFQADFTLTFVAKKPGFDVPGARPYLGRVEVLPIGVPVELINELLRP
ncbi:MAG: NAD(P)H-hydrate epimerase [Pirellulaceae bacterium]|nr:NAD(P)H-hydrate epimerase [Pirellulaceae bacterium]